MRRCSVLLSLLLAAFPVLAAQPAHAEWICAEAWTRGTVAPHADVEPRCREYPYGVTCAYEHFWVDPEAHVYAVYCYPRPF